MSQFVFRKWLATALIVVLSACGGDDDAGSEDGTGPDSQSPTLVVASAQADALRDRLLGTFTTYLERITGQAPAVSRFRGTTSVATITRHAEQAQAGLVFVMDAESLLPDRIPSAEIDALPNGSFRILAEETGDFPSPITEGETGATIVLLAGNNKLGRQYAVYEALRRLGVRYYHPEEEYVPRVPLEQLRRRAATSTIVARDSSPDYVPDFRFRGFTFHGAHPLEHLEAFSDGDFPIDEAVNVNDWIVKNRGESFRGAGRGVASEEARARRSAARPKGVRSNGFPKARGGYHSTIRFPFTCRCISRHATATSSSSHHYWRIAAAPCAATRSSTAGTNGATGSKIMEWGSGTGTSTFRWSRSSVS